MQDRKPVYYSEYLQLPTILNGVFGLGESGIVKKRLWDPLVLFVG